MELISKSIQLIKQFEPDTEFISLKPIEVTELFDGTRRRILEIKLKEGEILKKHQASEPITVFCLTGRGIFKAGENLQDEIKLEPGTLLTLEADIPHEIVAATELRLLLTKFKQD